MDDSEKSGVLNTFFSNIIINTKCNALTECGHYLVIIRFFRKCCKLFYYNRKLRDDTHMTSTKIIQFSRPPILLVHLRPKFFLPLDLGRPISNNLNPLQMKTNNLKEIIIQGWLLYVITSFLQLGFRFQYQLINLVWLSFDFFSFIWSLSIGFFVALYFCVSSCPKISRNVFYL